VNVNSALTGEHAAAHRAVGRTLSDVFPSVHAFAVHFSIDGERSITRNVIYVATASPLPLGERDWLDRIGAYPARGTLDRRHLRRMVADLVAFPDLEGVRPLTDDLAPIETMGF